MQVEYIEDAYSLVLKELDKNRLLLPTLPDVANRVMNAITNLDISPKQLATIILSDAALSARLIRVANSPQFRSQTEISNVQTAVIKLGNNTIRTLVNSMIMQQLFKSPSKFLENDFKQIWELSKNVSAISHALCSFAPHLNPNEAMLAGLVHQIGKLPILMLVAQAKELSDFRASPALTSKLLEKAHNTVGKIILEKLNFPANLIPVASEYNNFQYDSGAKADYVDVVQVAFLECIAGTEHPACRIDRSQVLAFGKLGISTDNEIIEMGNTSESVELINSLLL